MLSGFSHHSKLPVFISYSNEKSHLYFSGTREGQPHVRGANKTSTAPHLLQVTLLKGYLEWDRIWGYECFFENISSVLGTFLNSLDKLYYLTFTIALLNWVITLDYKI